MKKLVCVLLCVLFSMSVAISSSHAEKAKYNFTLGNGILRGDTTYRIGGTSTSPGGSTYEYRFPISELKFPLDVNMVEIGSSVELESWNVRINVKKNISDDAGKMEDSDWGYWYEYYGSSYYSRDSLDIFSESDAKLDALIIDINFQFDFFKMTREKSEWSLFMNYGYIYEKFDYEIYDLDQWYPSYESYFGTDAGHVIVNGKVLTYEITYHIPYIGIGTNFKMNKKFSIEPALAYTPYVFVRDRDDHILRSKISEGKLKGNAVMLSMEARYDFTSFLFAALSAGYTKIEAEGTQDQAIGGVSLGTIEQEIESSQTLAMMKIGYTF